MLTGISKKDMFMLDFQTFDIISNVTRKTDETNVITWYLKR